MNFDEGPDLEEIASVKQASSSSVAPSSHSFVSLDMKDLSTIVEEYSLLMNEELCADSDEPVIKEACVFSYCWYFF